MLSDISTDSADYAAFAATITSEIGTRPDLAFDETTGFLTYTADGNPMADLVIDLDAINDLLTEGTESYTFELANPISATGADIGVGNDSITTNILDDEQSVWSIVGSTTLSEGDTAAYTIALSGTLQAGENASINLSLSDVSTDSADYAAFETAVLAAIGSRTDLTFIGGQLTFTGDGAAMPNLVINLMTNNDSLTEAPESFTVDLATPLSSTGSDVGLGNASVTTLINDNDQSNWSISGTTSLNEGATAQYTIALSGTLQLGDTSTVNLTLNDVSTDSTDYAVFEAAINAAIGSRTDLTFVGGVLTYTADGNPMQDLVLDLNAIDDLLTEGTESYSIEVAAPASSTGSNIGLGNSSVTTEILDDEQSNWSITGTTSLDEGDTATYTISLSGVLQDLEVATINLSLSDFSTDSTDYADFEAAVIAAIGSRSDLSFVAGVLTYTADGNPMADLVIDLNAIADSLTETPESYTVRLTTPASPTGSNIVLGNASVTTTINDLDQSVWSITGDNSVAEGDSALYDIALSGTLQSGGVATINLTLGDVSTDSADYAAFAAAVTGEIGSRADLTFDETTGLLTFTSDGSPMADLILDLDAIDDLLTEGTESFTVGLNTPTGSAGSDIGLGNASVTTLILDNNQSAWSITGTTALDEGDTAVYTIALSGTLQTDEVATINLSLSDLSTDSADYEAFDAAVLAAIGSRTDLTFAGGVLTYTSDGNAMPNLDVNLLATDDALAEGPESLSINLASPGSSTGSDIGLGNASVTTLINDNEQSNWSITGTTSLNEGDTASYTVALSGTLQSGEQVSVDLTLADLGTDSDDYAALEAAVNTAIGGRTDLTFVGGVLTYTGDGNAMPDLVINLLANDDLLTEGLESYRLELATPASSTGSNVGLGNSTVTTLIADQDQSVWSITGSTSLDEGDTAVYTVALSGVLQTGEVATVNLSLTDLSTDSGDYADFEAAVLAAIVARPDLNFASGVLTYTGDGTAMTDLVINLLAEDDALTEGPETFTVDLATPTSSTGSSIGLGNNSVTTLINGNDQSVWSVNGTTSITEGSAAQYTVSLTGTMQSGETATVFLVLADLETNNGDHPGFTAAILAAIGTRTDLSYDTGTALLTYTGDGSPMADLVIDLDLNDDVLTEGTESYEVRLAVPGGTTGQVALGNRTVTTVVDDNDSSAWSITGTTALNEGDTAAYTIALSGVLQTDEVATISLSLSDVSTDSADYAAFETAVIAAIGSRTDLTFAGGVLTYIGDGNAMANLIISLDTIDDVLAEGPESFTVDLASAASSTGSDIGLGNASVTTVINDNDQPSWSITGSASVDEGDTAQYTVALSSVLQSGEDASINLTLNDFSTDSADYGALEAAVNAAIGSRTDLTFVAGVLTYTGDGNPMPDLVVNLPVNVDSLTEGPESFQIELASPTSSTGATITLGNSSVTTMITDLDQSVWSISGTTSLNEGDTAVYTIALSGVLQTNEIASISLTLNDVSTDSGDHADFEAAVLAAMIARPDLTFASGVLTYTGDGSAMADLDINLGTVDDLLAEGSESYTVDLAGPASSTGSDIALVTNSAATVINDNDQPEWSITGSGNTDEGETASYAVELSGILQANETATINLSLGDISTDSADYASFATAVIDAIGLRTDLNFNATTGLLTYTGDGTAMPTLIIDLDVTDDALAEGPESFTVNLASPASTTGASIALGNASVTTVVNDNDQPVWSVSGDASVDEGNTANYTVALTGTLQSSETATINLTLSGVSTDSGDYADFAAAVTSAIGSRTDLMFDSGSGLLTYTGDGSPMEDLVISLSVNDDALTEGPETFTIEMANPASTSGADIALGNASVTTLLNDNDASTWSISGDASVDEGETAEFTIALSGTLQAGEEATINLSLNDVTTDSADYLDFETAVNAAIVSRPDLTFVAGVLTYTGDGTPMTDLIINLGAVDDSLGEGPESFTVNLTSPASTTGSVINLGNASVSTMINDIDQSAWSINGTTVLNEADTAVYAVSLSGILQSGEISTVELTLSDVSTDSADYADFEAAVIAAIGTRTDLTFVGGLLTYTADGTAMADLVINLDTSDDILTEGPESYTVGLANAESMTGVVVTIGNGSVSTLVNDLEQSTWSISGDTTIDEGDTATYTIALTGTLQADEVATIIISLSDISTDSTDYESFAVAINTAIGSRTDLTFDSGTQLLTYTGDGFAMADLVIHLDLIDDGLTETPESYTVDLSNPASTTGADITLGNASITTLINNNDQSVWSIAGDVAPDEDEGEIATFTVSLSGTLQAGVTANITLTLSDISTDSLDYASFTDAVSDAIGTRTDLTFDVGSGLLIYTGDGNPMADLVIGLEILDDNVAEGPESFTVDLAAPGSSTGADIALGNNAVVSTINDDEIQSWSISGDTAVDEGDISQYSIKLSGILQAGDTAVITLTFSDVETDSADHAAFVAQVTAAIGSRPDLTFDETTGVLTFTGDGNPMEDLVIELGVFDDVLTESPESFTIDLSNPASPTGADIRLGNDSVTTTIVDDEQSVWTLAGDPSVDEGDTAQYTVSLSGVLQAGQIATIELTLSDISTDSLDHAVFTNAVDAAVLGRTDLSFDSSTGLLTYTGDGNPMADLIINFDTIDDVFLEGPELFTINLDHPDSPTGANIDVGNDSVITTLNDDEVSGWSITGSTIVDEGSTAQFTVALSGILQAGETATIELSLGDIDTDATDYAAFVDAVNTAIGSRTDLTFDSTGGLLTFDSVGLAMTDLVINLDIIDDVLTEGPESLIVSLANAGSTTGAFITLGNDSITTLINDGDQSSWSISGDATIDEGNTAQYVVGLSGILQPGETASVNLGLNQLTTDSADYASLVDAVNNAIGTRTDITFDDTTGLLTYTGDGSAMTNLVIDMGSTDDVLTEGTESFTVDLTNPTSTTGADIGVGNASITTTINDNDQSIWSLVGDTSVNEGDTAQYVVALSGTLQAGETAIIELTFDPNTTDSADYASFVTAVDDAIGPRTDLTFDGSTGLLTYTGDGNPMADLQIELDIINDTLTEGTESYALELANPASTTGADIALGSGVASTVINDDEQSTWSLSGANSVDEGNTAQYTLTLSGTLQAGEMASINLILTDDSTNSDDYAAFADAVNDAIGTRTDLTFDDTTGLLTYTGDGNPMPDLMIDLNVVDDALSEGPETLTLSLSNPASTTGAPIFLGNDSIITLLNDNDTSAWSITGDTSIDEGNTAQYVIALSGTLQAGEIATINLTLTDVSTDATDYAGFVAAVNDAIGMRTDVSFDDTTGWLTYTGNGNPMADLLIDLDAVDDLLTEGDESFTVELANPGSSTGAAILLGNDSVTTLINDNDASAWSITGDTSVDEGDMAQYTISLSGALPVGDTATINISLGAIGTDSDDHAALVDAIANAIGTRTDLTFDATTGLLTHTGGGIPMADLVINLDINDDVLSEGPEDFSLELANPNSSSGEATLATASVNTLVNDNDQSVWSISGNHSVDEGLAAEYTVTLAGILQAGEIATVNLSFSDIETDNADHAAFVDAVNNAIGSRTDLAFDDTSGLLTYTGDGSPMTDLVINLDTTDDLFAELPETFTIELMAAASPTGADVVLGSGTVTTTIVDNDQLIWSLAGPAAADEGSTPQFTVGLTGEFTAGESVSVDLGLNPLTTNASDYDNFVVAVNDAVVAYAGPGTLVFDGTTLTFSALADGDSMSDLLIDLNIADDILIEGAEDFAVQLSNPVSSIGGSLTIDPANTRVTTTVNDTQGFGGSADGPARWSISGTTSVDEAQRHNIRSV